MYIYICPIDEEDCRFGLNDADQFWEAFNTEIGKHYELDKDTPIVLNGDGASWI